MVNLGHGVPPGTDPDVLTRLVELVHSSLRQRPRRPGDLVTRLLVVGGGITGLAAAWEGIQRGAEVTVVEASGRFGGKLVTEHVDGLTIEHGPDAVVAYRPAALALAAEVGLGERSSRSARTVRCGCVPTGGCT